MTPTSPGKNLMWMKESNSRHQRGRFAASAGEQPRKVSAALAEQGYTTPRGLAYSASAVKSMLAE